MKVNFIICFLSIKSKEKNSDCPTRQHLGSLLLSLTRDEGREHLFKWDLV